MNLSEIQKEGREEFEKKYYEWLRSAAGKELFIEMAKVFVDAFAEKVAESVYRELLPEKKEGEAMWRVLCRDLLTANYHRFMGKNI